LERQPSSPEVPVDFSEFDSGDVEGDAAPRVPKVATSAVAAPTATFSTPSRPSINRRVLLYGSIGAVAVIVLLSIGLGSRSPKPTRVRAAPSASATSHVEPKAAVPNSANAPTPQTTANATTVASASQPAASATETVDEEAKVMINVKPDGAVLVYKGKVVGRTPFILKQPRGEKRTYEVGKAGYATRRVVITGKEHHIGFELGLDVPHPDSL